MSGNPLQDQGVLNLARASVKWDSFPELNVSVEFLNRNGIVLRKGGSASIQLPTATGVVQSPQTYMPVTVTVNLLKSQSLSAAYQAQFQDYVALGGCTVRPDVNAGSGGLSPYVLTNCALDNVGDLSFAGGDAGWPLSFHGVWIINNSLFN